MKKRSTIRDLETACKSFNVDSVTAGGPRIWFNKTSAGYRVTSWDGTVDIGERETIGRAVARVHAMADGMRLVRNTAAVFTAFDTVHRLLRAYADGEENGGSIEWDDVDHARETAERCAVALKSALEY